MRIWVIADTHFGHKNVIKYCNRPFSCVEEMDRELIERWNSVVGKEDIVYHLGDFSMTHNKSRITEIVGKLNGKIILIMGNHDTKPHQWYRECGIYNTTRHPMLIDKTTILMHEPPDAEYISPIYNYIFGHVHTTQCPADEYPNCACVSVERTNYTPVELSSIQSSINFKRKKESHS